MAEQRCAHIPEDIEYPKPNTPNGCEECLATGSRWVHLRLCYECGHVGCCDNSPNRHATKHWHKTHHPVIARHTSSTLARMYALYWKVEPFFAIAVNPFVQRCDLLVT